MIGPKMPAKYASGCCARPREPAEHLAVPVARDGDPLQMYIEETEKNSAISWTEPTASTVRPSSTLKQSLRVSALFSATQYGSSSSGQGLKISNYFCLELAAEFRESPRHGEGKYPDYSEDRT
jgi:hypothetical protein